MPPSTGRRLLLAPLALCLLAASAPGCAHAPEAPPAPVRKVFHYRSASVEWPLDKPWLATLDPRDPEQWAGGVRVRLPRPGAVRVTSLAAQDAPVLIAVFVRGKKPIAEGKAPSTLVTPEVEGELFVVLRLREGQRPAAVQLTVALAKDTGPLVPPPPLRTAVQELDLDDLLEH